MKSTVVLLLCAILAAPGCAASRTPRYQTTGQQLTTDRSQSVVADYARQLPIGTRIRATTSNNRTVRGTLIKRSDQAIFVQPRTRLAEPPVEIPLGELMALDQELPSSGTGKAVAVGAAAGAGAALGVMLFLFAIFSD
jgi:hypothetical protein